MLFAVVGGGPGLLIAAALPAAVAAAGAAPDRLEACRYTVAVLDCVATAILAVVGDVPERGVLPLSLPRTLPLSLPRTLPRTLPPAGWKPVATQWPFLIV